MKQDLILLYSGGADSTLLLDMAFEMGYNPWCIIINYGQKHVKEVDVAVEYCSKANVSYEVLHIPMDVSSALTDGNAKYEGVSEWHVPSRNLIFIAHAVSIAEGKGIDLIWYGANYEDRENRFPDCYQEWVYKLNQLLAINGSIKIIVEAPLLGMTKDTIKKLLVAHNINESEIYSGYGKEKK